MKHWTEKLEEARRERAHSIEDAQLETRAVQCLLAEKALRKLVQHIDLNAILEVERRIQDATIKVKGAGETVLEFGYTQFGANSGLYMLGECPKCGQRASSSRILRDWYTLAQHIKSFEPGPMHTCPTEPAQPASSDTHDFLMLAAEHAREADDLGRQALEINKVQEAQALALTAIARQLSALHLHLDALTQYDKLTDTAAINCTTRSDE